MTASSSSDPPADPVDARLLAVPNVSEGADPDTIGELRDIIQAFFIAGEQRAPREIATLV